MAKLAIIFLPFFIFAGANHPAQADTFIIYVNDDAVGDNNGASWDNALTSLQDALMDPPANSEIWVAAGIYYTDIGILEADNNRQSTFWLVNDVAIYGGFAGTESSRDQRDWETNITVLSGDINQNDTTDENGIVNDPAGTDGNNAYHVVTASGTNATAILDGFTITAGTANGILAGECGPACGAGLDSTDGSPTLANLTFAGNAANFGGGGMFLQSSRPTLTNVLFHQNAAGYYGGGIYSYNISDAVLVNVTFRENYAGNEVTEEGGGGPISIYQSSPWLTNVTFDHNHAVSGGALHIRSGSPRLRRVSFTQNFATTDEAGGGAIFSINSYEQLTNVIFEGNRADDGGAIYMVNSGPYLSNILFSGNSTDGLGGGIYAGGESTVTLWNVTFSGNQAQSGGAMYGGGSVNALLYHVLIWGNSAGDNLHLRITSNNLTMLNNLVEGLNPGGTNLNGTTPANDPRFVRAVNCGADGCTDNPSTLVNEGADDDYGNLRLGGGSPALDAGDNSLLPIDYADADLDGNEAEFIAVDLANLPRVAAIKSKTLVADIGAYERANTAPVAMPGGPYNTNEGSSIQLNAAASTDDGGIVAYAWDCTNNGSYDSSAPAPTGSICTYADDGSYTLRLIVTDTVGAASTSTTTVTIANVIPVYTPPPPQSSFATNAKSFVLGSFTDPGTEGNWPITIDWGDDTTPTELSANATGVLPNTSHTYAVPGTYNVFVTVSDGETTINGGFQVIVNAPPPDAPDLTGPADTSAIAGAERAFDLGSFTDSGSSGPWQVTVNWGDDSTNTTFGVSSTGDLGTRLHIYASAGSYDATITVNDGALLASASFRVTVETGSGAESTIHIPAIKRP